MRLYILLLTSMLIPIASPACASSPFSGSCGKPNLPHYRLIRLHLPHGYTIATAQFTKDGLLVGEIMNGQPTVNVRDSHGASYAFVWRNGRIKTLPPPPGQARAVAVDASADGRLVAGNGSTVFDGAWLWTESVGVIWRDGKLTVLPTVSGFPVTNVDGIDKHGNVIGYVREPDQPNPDSPTPSYRSCKWMAPNYQIKLTDTPLKQDRWIESATGNTWLEQQSKRRNWFYAVHIKGRLPHEFTEEFTAEGINAHGDIVGEKDGPNNRPNTAMLRIMSTGTCFDLNRLVSRLPRGKMLTDAFAISDTGWIIATLSRRRPPRDGQEGGEPILLEPIQR